MFESLGRLAVRHPIAVIAVWLALAGVLLLTISPLAVVAQKNPPDFLPADAPVLVASQQMKNAFRESDAGNVAVVVLTNENGLNAVDEGVYRGLVKRLHADTTNVLSTQDFVAIPELRQVMTSEDDKAWTLPISLAGTMGTGTGQKAYQNAIATVKDATANSTLDVNVVGAAATFDDLNKIGARDQLIIEIATVLTVFTILVLVYRSLVAMLIPLVTIGVSMVVAQQVVAGLGEVGLGLGPQTIVLMTGMMMGAGTDYAVFLFSRYQECLRKGMTSDDAVIFSLATIGEVMAGSAGTVALTFLGLSFATLGVFFTIGPALAITILIALLGAVTLLPALIVLAGRRGWIRPRRDITGRFWRRSAVHIVRRPGRHLAASLVILLGLAGCVSLVKFNYDDRQNLPADAESNLGYEAMNKHFPISSTLQQFILVHASDVDLRSPKALADLEQMSQRISQLPGIDVVRGITRPTGEVLEEAKSTYQAGEVGSRLADASGLIASNEGNLTKLSDGANQLAGVLGDIRGQVVNAIGSVSGLMGALTDMQTKFGGTSTLDEIDRTAKLVANMRTVGDALGTNLDQVTQVYRSSSSTLAALNASPVCNLDPSCAGSRRELQRTVDQYDPTTMTYLTDLARALKETTGTETLDETVRDLGRSLKTAVDAAKALGVDDPGSMQQRIDGVRDGANTLADSSKLLAEGVQQLVDQTRGMGSGLDQASSFLLAMKRDAVDPPMSGFYIPPQILTQKEFKKAAQLFVSEDGHTVRYLVQTAYNPFGIEAMNQVDDIVATAESARPNTTLANAEISMVGFSAVNRDIRNYYNDDLLYIIVMTLVVVFLILAAILRAVVAPIYLVLSVVLSFASALGIGVVFFQLILGQYLSWSVPGMAFLVLVAVGADYNLLLISRIRDEARLGVRSAVIRTVGATGGVITSAGLIFAASMLALTVSSLATVVQMGFVIGVGLLLDTFIVRTITVPAVAVLVGDANWWPSKSPRAVFEAARKRRAAAASGLDSSPNGDADDPDEDPDDDGADGGYQLAVRKASQVAAVWRNGSPGGTTAD